MRSLLKPRPPALLHSVISAILFLPKADWHDASLSACRGFTQHHQPSQQVLPLIASTARTGCTRTPPRKPPRPTGPKPASRILGPPKTISRYPEWPECHGHLPAHRFFCLQLRSLPEQPPQDCAGTAQTRFLHASVRLQAPKCTSREPGQADGDTTPPFLKAQIANLPNQKTFDVNTAQAHLGLRDSRPPRFKPYKVNQQIPSITSPNRCAHQIG